jgi:4-hydroxythreonine-4-phosphate dehydrogenase
VSQPIIAITMGDAAGIGPEIIMRALAHADLYRRCRPFVVGDAGRLRLAGGCVGSRLSVQALAEPGQARFTPGTVDCVDLGLIPDGLPWGKVSPVAGDAAYRYIERAVALALDKSIDAICTAPLNKEALHAGGHAFPGHTEILAHLTGTDEVSMLLMTPTLKVIHVTAHMGLIDAIRRIEPGLVERTIRRGHAALVHAGVAAPRIGVCGINPHAGENGLFGYGEEEEKIAPAIERLVQDGLGVTGPLPADTLFFRAQRGDFDLVVAMYHDQGHAPVKVMGIETGVNVTVGLPVVRTSVDHGTAFDIAGTGTAGEASLIEAIDQAVSLSALGSTARGGGDEMPDRPTRCPNAHRSEDSYR